MNSIFFFLRLLDYLPFDDPIPIFFNLTFSIVIFIGLATIVLILAGASKLFFFELVSDKTKSSILSIGFTIGFTIGFSIGFSIGFTIY